MEYRNEDLNPGGAGNAASEAYLGLFYTCRLPLLQNSSIVDFWKGPKNVSLHCTKNEVFH